MLDWYDLAVKTEESGMNESTKGSSSHNKTGTLESLGFTEEYRTDHVALFHLVTHSNRRQPEDFFHKIVMALFLVKTLKTTSYFDQFKIRKEMKSSNSTETGNLNIIIKIPQLFYHVNFKFNLCTT